MEYTKLNNLTNIFNINEIEDIIKTEQPIKSYSPIQDGTGLFYYTAPESLISDVKKLLPTILQNEAEVVLCKIYKGALPHKDHDCKCKINFYLRASNAKTVYFSDPSSDGYSFSNTDQHNRYDIKQHRLRKTNSFVAQDDEIYLIDTSKIHAVIMPESLNRIIVSISFNRTYDEILGILKVDNNSTLCYTIA
jgi:hypothetical protein